MDAPEGFEDWPRRSVLRAGKARGNSALRYRLLVDVDFAEAEALEHAGDGAAGIVGGSL